LDKASTWSSSSLSSASALALDVIDAVDEGLAAARDHLVAISLTLSSRSAVRKVFVTLPNGMNTTDSSRWPLPPPLLLLLRHPMLG
jgi:hypothetical protein